MANQFRNELSMLPLDQILYEAYCNKAGWKSQITGADLPEWGKLPQNVKDCWWAAAEAAIEWAYKRDIAERK